MCRSARVRISHFLGGIVRYILENQRYFREYVVNYTNAAAIITEEFRDTDDLDGLFSGWDQEKNSTAQSRGHTRA
jgi:formate dehydrogenase major subunit